MAYWASSDNYSARKQDVLLANGYCLKCQRPLTKSNQYLCRWCIKDLKTKGLEYKRVTIGEVGRSTIPYQQHLHRKFFGCNAPKAYRGSADERIYNNLQPQTILIAERKLYSMLINMNNKHGSIFYKIKDTRNIAKRLLYNLVLYYLSYHRSDLFKSHAHFQASIVTNLFINIENTYIRTSEDNNIDIKYINKLRSNYNMKSYISWFIEIENITYPIIEELI